MEGSDSTRVGAGSRTHRFRSIPPFGECYGLDVIIDSSIDQQPELYCEGGDHATLVRLDQAEFARLNGQARHGSFAIRE